MIVGYKVKLESKEEWIDSEFANGLEMVKGGKEKLITIDSRKRCVETVIFWVGKNC